MKTAVNDMLVKACHKNGLMCDTNKRFNQMTLNNYISLLALKEGISLIGLVATSALADNSTSSIHHSEDSNKMNGLRTKLHLLTNAAGNSAPPCFCFADLSDTEMPHDEFIVWEVEGMW